MRTPTHPAPLVLAGGFVAGTFDITYAWIFWALKAGVPLRRIFQSVAAGLLGRRSFDGGSRTAALGAILHYFNATTMSATYYLASRRVGVLRRRPVLCGAGYGLLVYGVMNHIVVPLSAAGRGSRDPVWIRLSILVHALLVGIPIALVTSLAHKETRAFVDTGARESIQWS